MDKKLTFWGAAGFVVLYFVAVFAAEFIGFIHPVCWVLAPALGALLGALPRPWLLRVSSNLALDYSQHTEGRPSADGLLLLKP